MLQHNENAMAAASFGNPAMDNMLPGSRIATEYRTPLLLNGVLFTTLAWVALMLRFGLVLARRRLAGGDDRAMFAAALCSIGFTASWSVGFHWAEQMRTSKTFKLGGGQITLAVYLVQVFYYATKYCVKLSLLLLYLRIAAGLKNTYYRMTVATITVLSLQFLSEMLVTFVQCIPVRKYWESTADGHCINIEAFFFFTSSFTVFSDLILLALPVPTLWRIERPTLQRVGLVATFLAGGLSTICSGVRQYSVYIYTEHDHGWQYSAPIVMWSVIEINLGIICASVPAVKSLFSSRKEQLLSRSYTSSAGTGRTKPESVAASTTKPSVPKSYSRAGVHYHHSDTRSPLPKHRTDAPLGPQRIHMSILPSPDERSGMVLVPTWPTSSSQCIQGSPAEESGSNRGIMVSRSVLVADEAADDSHRRQSENRRPKPWFLRLYERLLS